MPERIEAHRWIDGHCRRWYNGVKWMAERIDTHIWSEWTRIDVPDRGVAQQGLHCSQGVVLAIAFNAQVDSSASNF